MKSSETWSSAEDIPYSFLASKAVLLVSFLTLTGINANDETKSSYFNKDAGKLPRPWSANGAYSRGTLGALVSAIQPNSSPFMEVLKGDISKEELMFQLPSHEFIVSINTLGCVDAVNRGTGPLPEVLLDGARVDPVLLFPLIKTDWVVLDPTYLETIVDLSNYGSIFDDSENMLRINRAHLHDGWDGKLPP